MAVTKVKCIRCGTQVDRANCTQQANRRYVCNKCLPDFLKEQEDLALQKKAEIEQSQVDAQAYKDLIAFICDLYRTKAPSMLIVTQIKKFKEEYGYTYQGMKATLDYFYNLQNHSIEDSMGVGIIPYVYNETRLFYEGQREMREHLKDYDYEKASNDIKIITVQRSEEDQYKSMHLIPLEDIDEMGEDE